MWNPRSHRRPDVYHVLPGVRDGVFTGDGARGEAGHELLWGEEAVSEELLLDFSDDPTPQNFAECRDGDGIEVEVFHEASLQEVSR